MPRDNVLRDIFSRVGRQAPGRREAAEKAATDPADADQAVADAGLTVQYGTAGRDQFNFGGDVVVERSGGRTVIRRGPGQGG